MHSKPIQRAPRGGATKSGLRKNLGKAVKAASKGSNKGYAAAQAALESND